MVWKTGGGVLPGKKSIIALSVIAVFLLLARTLYRDLTIDKELLKGVPPDMVIELNNVNFRRGQAEDLWVFAIESVHRLNGRDILTGVEGTREGLDGNVWHLKAPSGEFLESSDRLSLREGGGRFDDRGESFTWSAPDIVWGGKSSNVGTFPSGIVVSGDVYNMSGKKGEFFPSGKLYLEEGVMEWHNVQP